MQSKKRRSYRYQWRFKEVAVDNASLDRFSQDSMADMRESEEAKEVKEEIVSLLMSIAEEILTPRQKEIFNLRFVENLRQKEIADRLNITQGAVSLAINGIPNYVYKKKHGGIIPKLRKYCLNSDNPRAQTIAGLLDELRK